MTDKDKDSKEAFLAGKEGQDPEYVIQDDDPQPGNCGVGFFAPMCLQKFKTVGTFSIIYAITSIVMAALGLYLTSQITTLEKHFNFNSSVSGLLMSCNDFGYFLTCLFISYVSRRVHIPRFLALSCILYGLSALLCVVPYFGTAHLFSVDRFVVNNSSMRASAKSPAQICDLNDPMMGNVTGLAGNGGTGGANKGFGGLYEVSSYWRNLSIFLIGIGMVIQGISKSSRMSFVPVYIDDNTEGHGAAFYIGLITGVAIFGIAISFMMGGAFNKIYITLEATNLSRRDPRYLGAWWLGFVVFGVLALMMAIPLMMFPRRIIVKPEVAKAERIRKEKSKEDNKFVAEIKGFMTVMWKLLKTPCYVMVTLGSGFMFMSLSGTISFKPKFMEAYFGIPTWKVNMIIGAASVTGASLGGILGGIITTRLKLQPLQCLKLLIAIMVVGLIVMGLGFFIHCDQPHIISGDSPLLNSSQCVSNCDCNKDAFYPVCGEDGYNYFSPCHAGCSDVLDGGQAFSNCTCTTIAGHSTVTGGLCDRGCEVKFYMFLVLSFLTGVLFSSKAAVQFVIIVRSVAEAQKPMALGLTAFINTLIGWFPGPIIFGNIIETTCLISRPSRANGQSGKGKGPNGACMLYDMFDFRNKYLGAAIVLRVIALIFFVATLIYALNSSKKVFYAHGQRRQSDNNNSEKKKDEAVPLAENGTNYEKIANN